MEESAKEFPGVGKHEEVGDLLEHMEEEEEDDGNPSLFRRDTDVGFRGSFPSMAAMAEWPKLERDDPLVWPDAWKRPEIPEPLDKYFDLHSHIYGGREEAFPETENPDFGIAFQMVDITYSMYTISDEREIKKPHVDDPYGADLETFPPTYSRLVVDVRKEPEIRMFGTNAAGNSVCMRYRGFLPYLYIRMDPASSTIPEDYWDGEESKDKRAHVEQCVHARLQRYMCLPKENQERLRMASMHIDPFRALTERLCEEFSTLMEEISGDGGGMMAEEEEDQEVSEWLEFLSSYIESFREFHQDVISHQAIGDRSSSCCPHWVRACEARARAIERKNTSPGVSGIMMEGFFLGWFDPGTPECKIRCKMCHEMIELFDMIVKMARKTNGILMGQEGEEDPLKYYVRDAKMCIDRFCTILVDDVVEPVIAFEREDDMQSTPKEETHDFEYISNVRFEDCHQSMMACEEKDKARKAPFLRIELYNPRDCTDVRTASQYAGLLIHIPTFMPRRTHDRSEPFTSWIVTYESNIPFVLRFTADHDISGMGWVYSGPRAWTPVPVWDPDRKSKCQIEVYIDGWSLPMDMPLSEIVSGKPEWQQMAPLVWMFFDDEMAGQNPNRMPRPNNIGDLLSQSGVVIYRQNEKEPFEACVFSLGGSEPLLRRVNRREHISPEERDLYSRAKTYTFGSECDLMLAWRRMVEIVCPDFLCGYNSVDFDLPYMVRRSTTGVAVGRDTHVAFRRLSKVIEHEYASKGEDGGTYWRGLTDIRKERFQSKAFGLRENDKATTTGITQFDTLRVVKQNEKKRSYKLDKVARETLNMHKVPLPHTEITPKATSPYDVMRSLLDRYCLWDSILPKLIAVDNKTYDIIYTEMARITGVTMDHLLGKGQRVKITQRLLKTARRARMDDQGISRKICPSPGGSPYSTQDPISFLIPYQRDCPMNVNPSHYDTDDILEGEDDDDDHMTRGAKYSGATVLKARRGYYKEPTPTLDFSSLYPSIMQANNYCVTTYLGTREQAEALGLVCAWDFRKEKDYRWTPFDKMPDGDFVVAPNNAAFVTRKHRVGLMCVDLGEILAARSRRKKLMGQYDKGSTERSAHNGAQLGLKVTANSMYGYTAGCNTAVSEAVTSTGRFLLKFTRDLVYERGQREPRYENEQLYGDTVLSSFLVLFFPSHSSIGFYHVPSIQCTQASWGRGGSIRFARSCSNRRRACQMDYEHLPDLWIVFHRARIRKGLRDLGAEIQEMLCGVQALV